MPVIFEKYYIMKCYKMLVFLQGIRSFQALGHFYENDNTFIPPTDIFMKWQNTVIQP